MQHTATSGQAFDKVGISVSTSFDAGVPLRDVQKAASHADTRTTMRYDRARQSLDRHATYIVATFIAGSSRGDTTHHRQPKDATERPSAPWALRNPKSARGLGARALLRNR